MTADDFIPVLKAPEPPKVILNYIEEYPASFRAFLCKEEAGDILDIYQTQYGRDGVVEILQAGSKSPTGFDSKRIKKELNKYEIGLAFRTVLLPSLPAHLLVFHRRFWDTPKISKEHYLELIDSPDVAAALAPDSCLPVDHIALHPSPSHGASPLRTKDQILTAFVNELTWIGITPSVFAKALEFISNNIRTYVDSDMLRSGKGVTLAIRKSSDKMVDFHSLLLLGMLSAHCNISTLKASRLLDWAINIARWKPYLFPKLKAEPGIKGISLFMTTQQEPGSSSDLQIRWRVDAEKKQTYAKSNYRHADTKDIKEILDTIKSSDKSLNHEDFLGLTFEVGRNRLFSEEDS